MLLEMVWRSLTWSGSAQRKFHTDAFETSPVLFGAGWVWTGWGPFFLLQLTPLNAKSCSLALKLLCEIQATLLNNSMT